MTHLNVAFEILCLIKNSKKHWGISSDEINRELSKCTPYDINMAIDYLENHDYVRRRMLATGNAEKSVSKKTVNTRSEVFFITVAGEQMIINGGFSGRSKKTGTALEVNTDWIPNEAHVTSLSEDEARLIFEQSEKMLQSLVAGADMLVARMSRLMTLTMSLMALLLCYAFFRYDRYSALDVQLFSLVIGVCYLFCISVIIVLKTSMIKKDAVLIGTEPRELFTDILLSRSANNIKQFYITQIISHQNKIMQCRKSNKVNWRLYSILLWLTVLIPMVILLVYWLLKFSA